MTDQERRRALRRHFDNRLINVSIQNSYSSVKNEPLIKVKVENLSDTGVCLISSAPFELGQVILFSEDDMLNQGTVVWTCQSKVECKAGVQFP